MLVNPRPPRRSAKPRRNRRVNGENRRPRPGTAVKVYPRLGCPRKPSFRVRDRSRLRSGLNKSSSSSQRRPARLPRRTIFSRCICRCSRMRARLPLHILLPHTQVCDRWTRTREGARPVRNPVLSHWVRLFSLVPLVWESNPNLLGDWCISARPNHKSIEGSDPNHQGIWSPPRTGLV